MQLKITLMFDLQVWVYDPRIYTAQVVHNSLANLSLKNLNCFAGSMRIIFSRYPESTQTY